jgi:hypothetical protein
MEQGNPHPHASDSGQPCFGEGEGKMLVHKLLGERKWNDLVPVLWMWIKTYKNEQAYVRVHAFYDDRLRQGYPVFDSKGTRIVVNEDARLTAGEQIKLTKIKDYNKRFEETKHFTPQKA